MGATVGSPPAYLSGKLSELDENVAIDLEYIFRALLDPSESSDEQYIAGFQISVSEDESSSLPRSDGQRLMSLEEAIV